jgi:4-hydroxy-3-polyprenylbenzoate decarboxylase
MPFRERRPEEILTIANRILGSGQTSLAKFLFIAASDDDPSLDTHDISHFLKHVLERVDWRRDLHFYTKTTIDTLDYSGSGWNEGSKVVIACRGDRQRRLATEVPTNLRLPTGFASQQRPALALPGVLMVQAPAYSSLANAQQELEELAKTLEHQDLEGIPLLVLVDDSAFSAATLNNFLWVTFTRANPSHDIHGVKASTIFKHWGCEGPLLLDARVKPHHAPELVTDPATEKKATMLVERYLRT